MAPDKIKSPRIVAEIGSCHGGDLEIAKAAILQAKEAGSFAIKFQLFPNQEVFTKTGNIYLPREWWLELVQKAKDCDIEIFASVWDDEGQSLLESSGCHYVKYAWDLHNGDFPTMGNTELKIIASHSLLHTLNPDRINLYCIPEYPVPYEVNFDGIFKRFDGFSDHTMGIRQTKNALYAGADYIEKHFYLDESPDCPDRKFAISVSELEALCKFARMDKRVMDERFSLGK